MARITGRISRSCNAEQLEADLGAYFFRIVNSVLLNDPNASTEEGFENALDTVVSLFRALQRPGLRTVEGLWAELAVILWAADPVAAMSAWHSSPRALHDFSAGSFRLEVKASLSGLREHAFLLDQLETLGGGATVAASILLDETAGGASVFNLVEAIGTRIGIESAARLQTIVANSLGSGSREAGQIQFSLEGARASLRLYRGEDVPTVLQPLPGSEGRPFHGRSLQYAQSGPRRRPRSWRVLRKGLARRVWLGRLSALVGKSDRSDTFRSGAAEKKRSCLRWLRRPAHKALWLSEAG